ncbi:MAG TPA: c-type cytochrome [Gemmatimonadales bacterium]|nr:c-type cytochrome [Gemmatimonadales bacterium]
MNARLIAGLAVALTACGGTPEAEPPADTGFAVPHDSMIPDDALGLSIRRGRALLLHTKDSLPEYVGNALTCTNCHPDAGTRANAMPWIGVYGRFPQYRSRSASVQIIEDRIDDCFIRSMNGRALPRESTEMRDMIAYMAFLSRGTPVGVDIPGQGLPKLDVTSGDSAAGAAIYRAECARCHGEDGDGGAGPPVWGSRSYNIGAGMSRLRTAAAFIRRNMPMDRPGILTDQQATDVAAYINSQPRPDLPGKEHDWPNGDPPPDVAYETLAGRKAQP